MPTFFKWLVSLAALLVYAGAGSAQPAEDARLVEGFDQTIAAEQGQSFSFAITLPAGGSANIEVEQQGVDLIVEVLAPDNTPLTSIDSPNGRNGVEPVEIMASPGGDYQIVVRPFSAEEPAGAFRLRVAALRDRTATQALLQQRREQRLAASLWLREHGVRVTPSELARMAASDAFRRIVDGAQVIGLGEATHGSREFGDARLALTTELISHHGFRLVALESGAARLRALRPWLHGGAEPDLPPELNAWIGVRTRSALLAWVRRWNIEHPADLVEVAGVDAAELALPRAVVSTFIGRAYGADAAEAWRPIDQELAQADEQTPVFGDSSVSEATRSAILTHLARLGVDADVLRARLGDQPVDGAMEAATDLAQFADFNAGSTPLTHSRDWYMAANLMRSVARLGSNTKAIYWAHNAHVVGGRPGADTAGAVLRASIGCRYRSVALTFGRGGFLAQAPNDPVDRLTVTTLPPAAEDSIDGVLHAAYDGAAFVSWPCQTATGAPEWLAVDRPLRWIGALWAPDTPASLATRPYTLARDFDGVLYFARVSSERAPAGRVAVPPRQRAQ